jgi:hypothetical protein
MRRGAGKRRDHVDGVRVAVLLRIRIANA